MLEELSIEEFVMGEENFHEGSAGFSSIIKKKHNESRLELRALKLEQKLLHI